MAINHPDFGRHQATGSAHHRRQSSMEPVHPIREDMPFLYNLVLHKIQRAQPASLQVAATPVPTRAPADNGSDTNSEESETDTSPSRTTRETPLARRSALEEIEDCQEPFNRANRPQVLAATVCSMVAFGANRRDNALQIQNSVVFSPCSQFPRQSCRVEGYPTNGQPKIPASPNHMPGQPGLRGNVTEGNTGSQNEVDHLLSSDNDASLHFQAVLKSQITKVLLDYIATPADKKHNLPKFPPPIDPIAVKKPDISMFKLMIASDNSTDSVGDVLEGFLLQTKLTAEQFYT
ncbi:uncharacterized protein PGTG_22535 [Puccinia graminis f. sp. tritici CRL 75-36-700-3]|uniref:DUF6589 domain-containing protein n=1 Tax=Puccinia graminis f. sp. tritici (strain CRL 75-36-700-3 / race SCCL) TaxID=418459 RepID=H6QUW4_PUCGT|nr:uncharacterized protein PGTG_22535 [Puccinia graminis f. sp. tritici CRL 75-36-700-3]EHS64872.1 hypothetical protein PGTG_22535 [Puccinia graminis f. sp. tritici CRL 75-36-700-3]